MKSVMSFLVSFVALGCLAQDATPELKGLLKLMRTTKIQDCSRWDIGPGIEIIVTTKHDTLSGEQAEWDEMQFMANDKILLTFNPGYNHFLNITKSGDLVFTYWTHGIYEQVIVFAYENEVKKVFETTYADSADLFWDPSEMKQYLYVHKRFGHAQPADTYIYRINKHQFILNIILMRNLPASEPDEIK